MVVKRSEVPAKDVVPGLIRRVLACGSKLMLVEHWHEAGVTFPWHEHPHEQLAYIMSGKLVVETESDQFMVEAGDSFVVPGGVSHRVTALEVSVALDVFTPIREDYL